MQSPWAAYSKQINQKECLLITVLSGAPNENIVQNHLNVALLNEF